MDKGEFTPGPWLPPHFTRDDTTCKCGHIFADEDHLMGSIATVNFDNGKSLEDGGNDCPPLKEAIANAHLIAVAPDMFAALKDAVDWFESHRVELQKIGPGTIPTWITDSWSALSKARGES